METQHTREMDKNRESEKNKDSARRSSESMTGSGGMAGNSNDGPNEAGTLEQAKTMARNVGEQALNIANTATGTAQDLARKAREQTSAATDTLVQQGTQAGQYLTRNVNEYPLTALLIAGAIGYGLGYLIHSGWTSEGRGGRSHDDDRRDSQDRRRHD
jgi:ElaB/YqjD/DUF883 family membrane-anchored ribosome-binding protein